MWEGREVSQDQVGSWVIKARENDVLREGVAWERDEEMQERKLSEGPLSMEVRNKDLC